jgi:hypothetical protein
MTANTEEKFSRASEIRMVKLGLVDAITAANLNLENRTDEMRTYEVGAKETLDYLANPESPIHKIKPFILRDYGDTVQKARETFPNEASLDPLHRLLEVI